MEENYSTKNCRYYPVFLLFLYICLIVAIVNVFMLHTRNTNASKTWNMKYRFIGAFAIAIQWCAPTLTNCHTS